MGPVSGTAEGSLLKSSWDFDRKGGREHERSTEEG